MYDAIHRFFRQKLEISNMRKDTANWLCMFGVLFVIVGAFALAVNSGSAQQEPVVVEPLKAKKCEVKRLVRDPEDHLCVLYEADKESKKLQIASLWIPLAKVKIFIDAPENEPMYCYVVNDSIEEIHIRNVSDILETANK